MADLAANQAAATGFWAEDWGLRRNVRDPKEVIPNMAAKKKAAKKKATKKKAAKKKK